MLHIPPTNRLLQAAKQEPNEKAYLLTKKFKETFKKRYAVERMKKVEIRPAEQSEKAESRWENL